ncbi:MAG: ATP-binding cassette domain-containing protein [Actinobacteria bacterium]|nr:ATP-binding cassette domain-containing protein [Actinomycetota bacterium]MCL6105069.1 ATP-binding cassette domain-containing protein [Actinomycetota bacterium]
MTKVDSIKNGNEVGVAIGVDALAKSYGDVEAVKGVSFQVLQGETFGFLGPNGAGKSTTISMLCTLVKPTAGKAIVAGFDVLQAKADVRRNIGLVFQDTTLDDYLTAEENLRFHAELYGVPKEGLKERMDALFEMVGLEQRRNSIVGTYSGGMKRRLEIIRGLLHSPRVLFLDEPTIGLDPQTRTHIWEYIESLRKSEEITMFLTTHYMDEAENCDRIAIIDDGEIVAIDTPERLKASVGADRVGIGTQDNESAISLLREHFGLEATMSEGLVVVYVEEGERFVPRLFDGLGMTINSVSITRPTLDDVFMNYTGRTIRDAEASVSEKMASNPWLRRRR